MIVDKIAGIILVTISLICGTVLAREWIIIRSLEKRREEQKREERRQNRDKRFHDGNEALYLETKAELEDAKTRIGILEEQLRKDRELMRKVKVADLRKEKDDGTSV